MNALATPVWTEKTVKVADLKPYERNPRRISKEAFQKLKDSLSQMGYHQRIIAQPDLRVVGGHQRILALTELGIKEIKVLVPNRPLTDDEFRRLLIQDNLPFGEFDYDILAADYDIDELTAFGMPEQWLLHIPPEPAPEGAGGSGDPNASPELQDKTVAQLGDVWLLGPHRVMCGDCTIEKLITDFFKKDKAELCFTSPPYTDQRSYGGANVALEKLTPFIDVAKKVSNFLAINLGYARKDGEVFPYWNSYIDRAKAAGLKFLSWNVWDKGECGSIGNQTAMFGIRHEWILVFGSETKKLNRTQPNKYAKVMHDHTTNRQKDGSVKDGWKGQIAPARQIDTVLNVSAQKARNLGVDHPAMFPAELPQAYIEAMTSPQQIIYDPFLGSGTTLIAAQLIGRRCFGIEINPQYVDLIIRRYQDFTGQKATLESTGKTFEETAKNGRFVAKKKKG